MVVNQLDLHNEALLDSKLCFDQPISEFSSEPKAIFLTGATGFLGGYLLNELLLRTKANIYCLIRCSSLQAGRARLLSKLKSCCIWDDCFLPRLIIVPGDLSQPRLGLSEQEFDKLAAQLDVIYHAGAFVNSSRPYSTLRDANVLSTKEILRLADLHQTKPTHFVSSLAIFFNQVNDQSKQITEADVPNLSTLNGGYRQSKAVAEKLIETAQIRGLPASIYRCTRMLGHSKTGITSNSNDLLCRIIKACIQLGQFPEMSGTPDIVPVDYASRAIIFLSRQKDYLGKTFHLLNQEQISWTQIMSEIANLGYSLEEIPYGDWLTQLKLNAKLDPTYASLRLILSARKTMFLTTNQFSDRYTRECLADSSIRCPPVNQALISKYINYFETSGYLSH